MRPIKKIIVHCSATPPDMDIGVHEIRIWHKKENGWKDIGYHWVIRRNGEIEAGRDLNDAGAHTPGQNSDSIGVCLVGGVTKQNKPENNFKAKQMNTLRLYLKVCRALYPNATIHGHNEFSNKACPSFDVQEWLRENYV
jgi:N-acetylmuramoyl-L-alanine amidase